MFAGLADRQDGLQCDLTGCKSDLGVAGTERGQPFQGFGQLERRLFQPSQASISSTGSSEAGAPQLGLKARIRCHAEMLPGFRQKGKPGGHQVTTKTPSEAPTGKRWPR